MTYPTKLALGMCTLLGCASEASFDSSGDAGLDSGLGQGGASEDAGRDAGGRGDDAGLDAARPRDAGSDGGPGFDAGADAAVLDASVLDASVLDAGADAASFDAAAADAGGDAGHASDASVPVVTVFTNDFEGDTLPANLDPGQGSLTPSQGFASYGPPGNQFGGTFLRSATANVVTLTLTDLPPHTSLSLDLLFAAIDSLDGEGQFPADDFFRVTLDGKTIFRESFANAIDTQIQSYVPPPNVVLARRIDLGFNGPGSFYTDSAYDFSQDPAFDDWPHSASTAVITFTLEGTGVQDINDESWAIDNVRVILGDTPRALPDAGSDAAVVVGI